MTEPSLSPSAPRVGHSLRPRSLQGVARSHFWALGLPAVFLLTLFLTPSPASSAETSEETAAEVPVAAFTLDNGMRFLAVTRPQQTTVHAAWVAHVGSSNERPGITGISHFFEHMMFKGTSTIGTTDAARDREIIAEQEEIQEQIRAEYRDQRRRWRLGEIDDPFADAHRTERQVELEARFAELVEEQRSLTVNNEFDKLYKEAGASGMNAFTNEDMTGYFVTVPANKLEMWFWMESDRLFDPAFREFYAERDVVYEERRLRTESSPTGEFDEMFNSMFWQSHPYSWPVVGWPSDLEVYTQAQADEYYDTYYSPDNLTGILVGSFDLGEAKALAERYFGRLERGKTPAPDVVTLEMEQRAEKRMLAACDCQPQVTVMYHTVPFLAQDSYALDVLAGLLNGNTGRLYKALVLDQGIASSAATFQDSKKWAGAFSFQAETKGDATPEQLEDAWYRELEQLRSEPIPERELRKVKNNIAADAYRRLQNPFFLALQLIFFDGLGDWQYINTWAQDTLAVSAEDVQRVAKDYFEPKNRAVALYRRLEGTLAEEVPPELAELPPQMQQMVQAQLKQIREAEDPATLEQALAGIEQGKANAPPQFQAVFPLLEKAIQERLEELQSSSDEGGES